MQGGVTSKLDLVRLLFVNVVVHAKEVENSVIDEIDFISLQVIQ